MIPDLIWVCFVWDVEMESRMEIGYMGMGVTVGERERKHAVLGLCVVV